MLKPSGPYFLLSKATPWNKHNEKSRFLNSSVCKIKKKWILFYCWKLWFIAKNLLPNMVTGEMAFRLSISSWYSLLMLSNHTKKSLLFRGEETCKKRRRPYYLLHKITNFVFMINFIPWDSNSFVASTNYS